jgi:hypothetical protein
LHHAALSFTIAPTSYGVISERSRSSGFTLVAGKARPMTRVVRRLFLACCDSWKLANDA